MTAVSLQTAQLCISACVAFLPCVHAACECSQDRSNTVCVRWGHQVIAAHAAHAVALSLHTLLTCCSLQCAHLARLGPPVQHVQVLPTALVVPALPSELPHSRQSSSVQKT